MAMRFKLIKENPPVTHLRINKKALFASLISFEVMKSEDFRLIRESRNYCHYEVDRDIQGTEKLLVELMKKKVLEVNNVDK